MFAMTPDATRTSGGTAHAGAAGLPPLRTRAPARRRCCGPSATEAGRSSRQVRALGSDPLPSGLVFAGTLRHLRDFRPVPSDPVQASTSSTSLSPKPVQASTSSTSLAPKPVQASTSSTSLAPKPVQASTSSTSLAPKPVQASTSSTSLAPGAFPGVHFVHFAPPSRKAPARGGGRAPGKPQLRRPIALPPLLHPPFRGSLRKGQVVLYSG